MEIVNDQDERFVQRIEVDEQPLDYRLTAKDRCRVNALDQILQPRRIGKRVDDRQPEVLCVLLAAVDPTQAMRSPRSSVSTHDRSSSVLPLPAGAQTRTTLGADERSSNNPWRRTIHVERELRPSPGQAVRSRSIAGSAYPASPRLRHP